MGAPGLDPETWEKHDDDSLLSTTEGRDIAVLHFTGAVQCRLDVRHDVFAADMIEKARLQQKT